jgi:hypothetical protein
MREPRAAHASRQTPFPRSRVIGQFIFSSILRDVYSFFFLPHLFILVLSAPGFLTGVGCFDNEELDARIRDCGERV